MAKQSKASLPQTVIVHQPISTELEILQTIVDVNAAIVSTNASIVNKLGNLSLLAINSHGSANISNCAFTVNSCKSTTIKKTKDEES